MHCSVCQKPFDPASSPAMPFCSHRCREIDLGRWLSETNSIPRIFDPEEGEELKELHDSEMWSAGRTVRGLRPENQ